MDLTLPKRCFNVAEVISSTTFSCQISLHCKQGTGTAIIYQLSPAVLFAYFDFHARAYLFNKNRRNHILEINYCIQGRCEHVLSDGSLQYLGKNDMIFNLESHHSPMLAFPLGYYTGVGIVIDLDNQDDFKHTFPCLTDLDIQKLAEKIFSYGPDLYVSMGTTLQNLHIMPENLPEYAKRTWLRLKTAELLLFLNYHSFEQDSPQAIYKRQQAELIKDIHKKMISNLSCRYTIEDLSKQHFISPTKLKKAFKDIYGESIGTYMKNYRIQKAAEWLRESDMSIESIGSNLGYQNFSKFSSTFKGIMGCSPIAYRKQYQK